MTLYVSEHTLDVLEVNIQNVIDDAVERDLDEGYISHQIRLLVEKLLEDHDVPVHGAPPIPRSSPPPPENAKSGFLQGFAESHHIGHTRPQPQSPPSWSRDIEKRRELER